MKPSLQLKIGQHLTMTPQLQQAIRLLQLSSLDLQTEIQSALESNPMLDGTEDGSGDDASSSDGNHSDHNNAELNHAENENVTASSEIDTSDALKNENIEKDLVVDTQWEDWQYTPPSSISRSDDDREFEFQGETTESLHDHLIWQLDLTPLSEKDKAIATIIIDEIDDEGYLRTPIEELLEHINQDISSDASINDDELDSQENIDNEDSDEVVEADEVEAVLHMIQSFDPIGVGARDLQECLKIQLKQFDAAKPEIEDATLLINKHFDALASRNYKQIIRQTKWTEDHLKSIVAFVQSLNPRPGSNIASGQPEYVVPDVFVSKKNGRWTVELNPDCAPKLRINSNYASLIRRADSSADNTYLKNNLQEAKWFIKSLQSRNDTLLKVATSIVEKQIGFFEYGEEAMKPLVLHDIAEEVEMHESTVSRVTTQKYMHTPRGIFELKYFFSSHVSTASGGECSSTAIRALIKKLIAAENNNKPLSDNKIATLLKDQGINVARRTIAKYREAMNIPPSNERKSLI